MPLFISDLANNGWVLTRALLEVGELERLRARFEPPDPGSTSHVTFDDTDLEVELVRAVLARSGLDDVLHSMIGPFRLRIHGREPGAGAGGQGLHTDLPARAPRAVVMLWLLDPFVRDNGATRVVPRSHVGATSVPRHLAQPGTEHPDEIVIEAEAGAIIAFDAHLWHSGRTNTSGDRRRALQVTAQPDVRAGDPMLE